jgi:hypothetical protein
MILTIIWKKIGNIVKNADLELNAASDTLICIHSKQHLETTGIDMRHNNSSALSYTNTPNANLISSRNKFLASINFDSTASICL